MRTEDIDHAWISLPSGQTAKIIGDTSTVGIDSAKTSKPSDASSASTHNSMTSEATPQTIWFKNTNTWAFGYVIEVSGVPKNGVTAFVTTNSYGHDHSGTPNEGFPAAGFEQKFNIKQDGVYTLYINGASTQNKILRPNRTYLMWVKQYDIRFSSDISFRVLAECEAVSDGTDPQGADFSSLACVTYYGRDGKVAKTERYNTHQGLNYNTLAGHGAFHTLIPATPLDYKLDSYTENGITYEHVGWSLTKNAKRANVSYVYGNMEVYPVFEAVGVPFAIFYSEDGEELDHCPIIPGSTVSTDIIPEKDIGDEYDYTFDYWVDKDGNRVNLSDIKNDIALYPHFDKTIKNRVVNVYSEDGSKITQTLSVKNGTAIQGLSAPAKKGSANTKYVFSKWVNCSDGKEVDITNVTENLDIRPVYTAKFVNTFKDLKDNTWYSESIEYAVLNGIMYGVEDTLFSPDTPTTRAMFVAVLYRLEGSKSVSSLNAIPFKDVPAKSYYADAVRWAYNMGVVAGTSATTFSPNQYITREQMSAMLYRYAANVRYYDMSVDEGTDFSGFIDADDVSDYAKDALLWMIQDSRKYIQGMPVDNDTAIAPQGSSTRAMMASILYRFLDEGKKLLKEFENPSSEFSAMPFWFWNDKLTDEEIDRQIRAFHEKGIDGFVIHPRMGLDASIQYMSESWLHFVKYAVELADKLGMHVILYDEAMYPSGSCHGQVVKENPDYASKGIKISTTPPTNSSEEKLISTFTRSNTTYYVIEAFSYGSIRGVYYGEDDNQAGAPRSADLLNPDSVATFIRLTHEKYYEALGEYFGNTIIGIFTDEPSMLGRYNKGNLTAWTDDLMDDMKAYGVSEDELYYLFYEKNSARGKEVNEIYNEVIYNRLKSVYYGQISAWCAEHNIALTGHPSGSMDIGLLSEFQIPCQDVVWRYVAPGNVGVTEAGSGHETMGKCASDAARHNGQRRNGNECCGACSLTSTPRVFTRNDFKWYIDWLFARGCNFLIPHAFYYSVSGSRGDERPPQLGMNGMFWDDWDELSVYIKRCSAMNTDSVNITDIAVLCTKNKLSVRATNPMINNQIEFNYLEEIHLKNAVIENGHLKVANQSYQVIVLDDTYSDESMKVIEEFRKSGGTVINYPSYASKTNDYISLLRAESFTALNIEGDPMLRMTHIRKYGKDIVYFTNEGESTISAKLHENVDEVWNPETGVTMKNYSGDTYNLTLAPRESIYLILK